MYRLSVLLCTSSAVTRVLSRWIRKARSRGAESGRFCGTPLECARRSSFQQVRRQSLQPLATRRSRRASPHEKLGTRKPICSKICRIPINIRRRISTRIRRQIRGSASAVVMLQQLWECSSRELENYEEEEEQGRESVRWLRVEAGLL